MAKTYFLTLFLILAASSAYASPVLHIDKPQFDFGTISQDDKAEHVFEIENRGDGELIIEKLTPS